MRVLILAQTPAEQDGEPVHVAAARALEEAGWEPRVVTLTGAFRMTGASADAGSGAGRTGAAGRTVRRTLRRYLRRTLEFLHAEHAASTARDFVGRLAGAFSMGEAVRRAHEGCDRYLAPLDIQRERLAFDEYAQSVWDWHERLLAVTYALPAGFLTKAVGRVGADLLRSYDGDDYDAVALVAPTPRTAAVGYIISRVLELPLIVDEYWSEDPGRLPSAVHHLKDRIFARADGRFTSGPNGVAQDADPAAAGAGVADIAGVLGDAMEAAAFRRSAHSATRPVVSAVVEATADVAALMRTIESFRHCTLPNWEMLVVVGSDDLELRQDVYCAIEELDDDRVRLFESRIQAFDLYGADVQHRSRADHFVRVAPGSTVRPDFVTRAASFVFGDGPAEGHYWRGALIKPGKGWRPANRGGHPYRPSLRDRSMAWYSLDGEYVMTWRLFRFFGGFTHVPADRYSIQIEQIVLAESSALSGLLFEKEVPLAYRRMATLSRMMGDGGAEGMRVCEVHPRPEAFVDDSADAAASGGRLAGKTVAFVRHALVGYDARLLKEASSLAAQGAKIIVAGIAEEVPESLGANGFEVISVADVRDARQVARRLAKRRPDAVHAYDVLSYDLIEPLFDDASVKLVYECRDLLVAPGYWPEERREAERIRERRIIERADAVIAVSQPSAEWIESEYGIETVAAIMHGATTVVREPEPVHEPVRLLFQGALRPNRGLFSLVTAMERFAGEATLTFQSFGVMENAIRRYVTELGLTQHVDFLDVCGPLEVVQYAASFDVGVICYPGSTENLLRTAPNKLLDYMSAGLAVVASDLPGVRSLADETNCAFFEPGSAGALAEAIGEVIGDRELLTRRKAASLERACEHRWSIEQERLFEVYEKVFDSVT